MCVPMSVCVFRCRYGCVQMSVFVCSGVSMCSDVSVCMLRCQCICSGVAEIFVDTDPCFYGVECVSLSLMSAYAVLQLSIVAQLHT